MSDDTFDRILVRLKVLGSIREKDRIYSQSNSLDVLRPSKWDFVTRFWNGEDRRHNIDCVKDTLSTSYVLLESLLKRSPAKGVAAEVTVEQAMNARKIVRLRDALEAARTGINNWKATYVDDVKTVQEIETLLASIDDELVRIQLSQSED